MKALVYHGPGKRAWEEKPKATLKESTDAVVRTLRTTICGTDLHILKGDCPEVTDGRALGHEGVGVVEEVGTAVTNFKKGIASWRLDSRLQDRRHADGSLYAAPKGADEEALVMLSDILPTGFECGVLNGKVSPGDTVAIVGAGPIGLAALMTAKFFSPSEIIMVDLDDNRLEASRKFGATQTVNSSVVGAVVGWPLKKLDRVPLKHRDHAHAGELRHLPSDRHRWRTHREHWCPRKERPRCS
jgi:alcohol dehydrogenase